MDQGGSLGFFDHRQPFEGAAEAGGDGGFVEGGKLELGQGGVDEVHAGDELLQPVVDEFGRSKAPARCGFGQTAAAGAGVEVALLGSLLDE